ncbi:MAG TPA: 3-hydroxyacyl-CoA dehydrogenase NAD-binding domain-containing protein [Chitinophagaceae bacterium]|nr:3-hydroxyacyl-CoA dehydrogenase NAD-binding domain-containing protein [Chitinophagaceae bacterium]HNF71375.1 3-hydroxyacyl-CoA dehydrogenase NAD-binding domain-containing protein [Chitinophagaceae bacterium]
MNMQKIGIIGAGTMGAGIAQVAATAGRTVIITDTNNDVLQRSKASTENMLHKLEEKGKIPQGMAAGIAGRMEWTTGIADLKDCSLVIEAIVENLDIKQKVFRELETIVDPACMLATNTSSLSVTSIASASHFPERVVGIHFFNPAPLMELVEIVPALQSSEDVVSAAMQEISAWGKKGVRAKDTPGFIVNRIARPYYSEAIRMAEEGLGSYAEIDEALTTLGGFRMGPFALMDLIGHDVNYTVTETVWKAFYFDPRYTPSFTQKRLVEAQWLGKKTGRGFYQYIDGRTQEAASALNPEQKKYILNRVLVMLINEAAHALYSGVASREDIDLAMTKGVNYPKGLLRWADELSIAYCVHTLDELYTFYHEDRYRCSPLLRNMLKNQTTFY